MILSVYFCAGRPPKLDDKRLIIRQEWRIIMILNLLLKFSREKSLTLKSGTLGIRVPTRQVSYFYTFNINSALQQDPSTR